MKKLTLTFAAALLAAALLAGCKVTVSNSSSGSSSSSKTSSGSSSSSSKQQSSEAGQEDSSSEPEQESSSENSAPSSLLSKAYVDMQTTGKYYIKCRMITNDADTNVEVAVSDGMMATKMIMEGSSVHLVVKDGKMYTIMHDTKMVMVMDMPEGQDDTPLPSDGIVFNDAGTGDFLGRTLPYEGYKSGSGDDKVEIRYYFDGTKLAGVQTISGDGIVISMEILEMSGSIPAGMFDVPTDYEIMQT